MGMGYFESLQPRSEYTLEGGNLIIRISIMGFLQFEEEIRCRKEIGKYRVYTFTGKTLPKKLRGKSIHYVLNIETNELRYSDDDFNATVKGLEFEQGMASQEDILSNILPSKSVLVDYYEEGKLTEMVSLLSLNQLKTILKVEFEKEYSSNEKYRLKKYLIKLIEELIEPKNLSCLVCGSYESKIRRGLCENCIDEKL